MAYSKEMIERLHDLGWMPDWAYYQQNGRSAQENYEAQKAKILSRYSDQMAAQTSAADDDPIAISIVSEVKDK